MFDPTRLRSLAQLPQPLLTVFVSTRVSDASVHAPRPSCLTRLKNEAHSLIDAVPVNQRKLFRQQLRRVEEFLANRTPQTNLVIFAGPKTWEALPLHVEIRNEMHWGQPSTSQLAYLAAEHRPYCIVVVNHRCARFFSYRLGDTVQLLDTRFELDTSQW